MLLQYAVFDVYRLFYAQFNAWFCRVLVVVAFFVFAVLLAQRKLKNSPPGPFRLPIIGNFHQMGSVFAFFRFIFCVFRNEASFVVAALAQQFGGLYSMQLGNRFAIVLADYEACSEVLLVSWFALEWLTFVRRCSSAREQSLAGAPSL